MLFLGGLFRTAFDGEFGAEVVEVVGEFAFALDDRVRFRLEAAGVGFEAFEAFAGLVKFCFELDAAFGCGAFAVVEFAAFPADVFEFGVEVLDFAGGEGELALEG